MKKGRVAVTISIPPDIALDYEKIAKHETKNKSQLFRDMFQLYKENLLEKEFLELQRYGVRQAKKTAVFTEEQVEKIVFEGR